MFKEYYLKNCTKRLILIGIFLIITLVIGYGYLSGHAVPAAGKPIETWLMLFYLCAILDLALGLLLAGFWFSKSLLYDKLENPKPQSLYLPLFGASLVCSLIISLVLLPAAYEGAYPARIWLILLAPVVYYLDTVFFTVTPVQFIPPYGKQVYAKVYSHLNATSLKEDLRFQNDFFTDKLYLIPATAKAHLQTTSQLIWQGQSYLPIYPLQKNILKYFTPDALEKDLHFQVTTANEPSIEVQLPYVDKDVQVKPLWLKNIFTSANVVIVDKLPLAVILPNFNYPLNFTSNKYYTYCDHNNAEFSVEPGTSASSQTTSIFNNKKINTATTYSGSTYPDLLVCQNTATKTTCGLLSLATPKPADKLEAKTATVSLGLGTFRSLIAYITEGISPSQLALADRNNTLFTSPSNPNSLENFLMPQEQLLYNIWDLSERDTTENLANLEQLFTRCLLEMIARGMTDVNWRLSVPACLTSKEEKTYQSLYLQALKNIFSTASPEAKNANVLIVSNSTALASYYKKNYSKEFAQGIIFIDITPTLTDITFFEGKHAELVYEATSTLSATLLAEQSLWGIAGLLYYAGILFGKHYQENSSEQISCFPNIYLCSKGPEILDLAAEGSYDLSSSAYKIFAQLFRDGVRCQIGDDHFKELMKSLTLKTVQINKAGKNDEEITYGLLYDEVTRIKYDHEKTVDAPTFTAENVLPDFKAFLNDLNLQMKHFLNKQAHMPLDDINTSIKDTINSALAKERLQASEDMRLEPIFTMFMKQVINLSKQK